MGSGFSQRPSPRGRDAPGSEAAGSGVRARAPSERCACPRELRCPRGFRVERTCGTPGFGLRASSLARPWHGHARDPASPAQRVAVRVAAAEGGAASRRRPLPLASLGARRPGPTPAGPERPSGQPRGDPCADAPALAGGTGRSGRRRRRTGAPRGRETLPPPAPRPAPSRGSGEAAPLPEGSPGGARDQRFFLPPVTPPLLAPPLGGLFPTRGDSVTRPRVHVCANSGRPREACKLVVSPKAGPGRRTPRSRRSAGSTRSAARGDEAGASSSYCDA